MWCNGENFGGLNNRFILNKQYVNEEPNDYGKAVVNFIDNSIKITKNPLTYRVKYRIVLDDTVVGDLLETATATIEIVKKSTNEVVISQDYEVSNGENIFFIKFPLYFFEDNEFEFFTNIRVSKPIFWKSTSSRMYYKNVITEKFSNYSNNLNNDATNPHKIDLIKSLPNMKVIDFLKSTFKTFNISIYDSSPSDENLLFLTPDDINTPNQIYSKLESDYTFYADKKEVPKSVNNPYNYYNFKHKTSNYRSNKDFKTIYGIEYGQTYFPNTPPAKPNEFKVETEFSIVPPIYINGSQIYTAYGFTNSSPSVDEEGRFRYEPNVDEPTLMYNHGSVSIPNLGCQNVNTSNILINSPLNLYIKSMPYCKQNNNSLAFSVLRIEDIDYIKTLYSIYYSKFISRLLNINALSQIYTLNLPSNEIYINDAEPLRPKGFRLQNDIVIGETRFETLEANIDVTTGKTKLTLLNY